MIHSVFSSENIELYGVVPFSLCRVDRPDFITRRGLFPERVKSVIVFAVPYLTGNVEKSNLSLYARSLDYHRYCDALFVRLTAALTDAYGKAFVGFADKSPISETTAAAMAGLGVIGDNHLLITEKYGTFVFLGEILSEATPEELGFSSGGDFSVRTCLHCGACRAACPMTESGLDCLSAVTQKKGDLSPEEEAYLLRYGSAWGCDICQICCPLVQKAIKSGAKTPIPFFYEDRVERLTTALVEEMDEETFAARAFSWRGKKTVLRNLKLLEKK